MAKHFLRSFLLVVLGPVVLSASPPIDRLIVAPGEEIAIEAPAGFRPEACLDGGILRENPGHFQAPTEGAHWLLTASRDELGRRSDPQWIRLLVDGQAPELSLELKPISVISSGREWVAPRTEARVRASDELSGVGELYVEDGGRRKRSAEESLELSLPASGSVEIRAGAIDRVGNRSPELSKRLDIDEHPPQIEWKIEGPWVGEVRAPVIAGATRIRCLFSDGESGLKSAVATEDGETLEQPVFGGAWSEGAHGLECSALDEVGNRASEQVEAVVDLSPPEIRLGLRSRSIEGHDGKIFARPPVSVNFEAEDAPAGLERREISLDGAESRQAIEGIVKIGPGEKPLFRAFDRVGNSAEQEAFWIEDGEGPRIVLRFHSDQSLSGTAEEIRVLRGSTVSLRLSDAGCGVEGARYRFDEKAWHEIPKEIVFGYPDTRSMEIEAWDRLGNRSLRKLRVRVLESEGRR